MSVYAVYDTNVLVSALLSRNANAATVKVLDACLEKQQIIPDYLSLDKKIVADAKYIPLNEKSWFKEDSASATAIYYKTITYMYRFCSKEGYLFYPHPDEEV